MKNKKLELAKAFWSRLGDVPVNNQEEIDEEFEGFEKGTDIYSIWHYVEETFDVSIAQDLMYFDTDKVSLKE